MKKFFYLLILITFFSQSVYALATTPLNKKIISAYVDVNHKLAHVNKKFPGLLNKANKFKVSERDELIFFLRSSRAYLEINDVLTSSGFDSVDSYVDTTFQIMGSIYAVQFDKMPNTVEDLKSNITMMKSSEYPKEKIHLLEKDLEEAIADREEIKLSIAHVTEEDKKFVSDNIEWLETQLSSKPAKK